MKTNLKRIQKDIENLSKFNATPDCGLTRFSFTKEDRLAREYIKEEMRKAGLYVYEDAVGTVVGRLEGKDKDASIIMVGSHYDSVKNGGNFDGPAGVSMALEIARTMKDNNVQVKYPIEFVALIEEEGGRFGSGLFGSRGMVGKLTRNELDQHKDVEGISIAEAMKNFGFDPDKIKEAIRKPERTKAFFELHIEQGPVLEHNVKDVGIVECIVGIRHLEVIVKGRPDHAGTTPMNMRRDALDVAAAVISQISNIAKKAEKDTVATVGVLEVLPGATNIVPGEVKFTIDIRSKDENSIDQVIKDIIDALKKEAKEKRICYTNTEKLRVSPVKLDEDIIKKFNKNCEKLGFSKVDMLSGAGHDAMMMAEITKVGLVFVPSKDGRSHCPEEWTEYKDLQKGIELVYHTILDVAEVVKNED